MTTTSDDVTSFNAADGRELGERLLGITAAPEWADRLVADRPYSDLGALLARSDEILAGVSADQVDAALAGHPRIGERAPDGATDGDTNGDPESAARSAREQAGMDTAGPLLRRALAETNAAYEQRFGRIYLIAAAGRSAAELLAIAQSRLNNDPETELDVVRSELATITRTRIIDWLT